MTRRPRVGGGRLWRDAHEGGPVVAAPEVPLQIADLACWWDSRTTAQMSPSPETGVSSWASRDGSMGPVALSQATPGARPLYVASVPQLGGKPGVQFDGVDDWMGALLASDWRFLHNGLGSTIFYMLRADSTGSAGPTLVSTAIASSAVVGVNEALSAVNVVGRITNGTASVNVATHSTPGHFEKDILRWRGLTHGGGVRRFYAGAGAASLTQADAGGVTAASGDPSYPLRVATGGGSGLKGWLAQLLIYKRDLPAAEVNAIGAFFAPIYGIAA